MKRGLLFGVALLACLSGARDASAFIEVCVSVTGRTFTLSLLPCQAGEVLITWGDSGPPGPPGPIGPAGPPAPAPADPPPLGVVVASCGTGVGLQPGAPIPIVVGSGPNPNIVVPNKVNGAPDITQNIPTAINLDAGVYAVTWWFDGSLMWNAYNVAVSPLISVSPQWSGLPTIGAQGGNQTYSGWIVMPVAGSLTFTYQGYQGAPQPTPGLWATGSCQIYIQRIQ